MKFLTYFAIALVLNFGLSVSNAYGQQLKIASVDMQKIFNDYYKTKKANNELNDRRTGFEKELKEKFSQLEKLKEEGQKLTEEVKSAALSEEKRTEKQKTLDSMKIQFGVQAQSLNELKANRERELAEQYERMKVALLEEISKVIQDKAKREGYSLVIDRTGLAATTRLPPPFVYVQESLDITNDVVKTLNANAPAGAAASPSSEKKEKK